MFLFQVIVVYLCPVSKSVQKNRRKKQHTKPQEVMGGRSQEQKGALSVATHLMGGASIEGGGDNEKRIKNLKKVATYIHVYVDQCVTYNYRFEGFTMSHFTSPLPSCKAVVKTCI